MRKRTPLDTLTAQQAAPRNALTVNVSLAVDFQQLADWPPETLRAFMLGIANVVSAKRIALDARPTGRR